MKLQKQNKNRISRKLKKKLKKSEPHMNWNYYKLQRSKGQGKYGIIAVKRKKFKFGNKFRKRIN